MTHTHTHTHAHTHTHTLTHSQFFVRCRAPHLLVMHGEDWLDRGMCVFVRVCVCAQVAGWMLVKVWLSGLALVFIGTCVLPLSSAAQVVVDITDMMHTLGKALDR